MSSTNQDLTLHQDGIFNLDRNNGILDMEVMWTLDGYPAPHSGNLVSGTVVLWCAGNLRGRAASLQDMEVLFDLSVLGGKIESIVFAINDQHVENGTIPDVIVNGKQFVFQ